MEKSTGAIIVYGNKYRITVKRFEGGIINESICHDDKFDNSVVYGYRFNWNLIPNFREMSVKDIRKEIEKHFMNYITSC